MRRIKSLLVFALMTVCGGSMSAQTDGTFQFVNADNEIVPDGSTCTFNAALDEDWGEIMAAIDLSVKNTSDASAYVSMSVQTEALPGGHVQVCFPMECVSSIPANFTSGSAALGSGETRPLNSEWFAAEGKYGTAVMTMQLHVMEQKGTFPNFTYTVKADGPKIKVNCIYSDPAGISGMTADRNATVNVYDLTGKTVMTNRPASAMMSLGKGLYICETMKDGKRVDVKKIVR